MSPRPTMSREQPLRKFVHDLNQAWFNRDFEELAEYFHDDIVILSPDRGKRLRGKKACVKSYEQFMASSKVHMYKESGFTVDTWGSVAVVAYKFRIRYEWNGKSSTDTGRDVFLVIKEGRMWKVVWRTLVGDRA